MYRHVRAETGSLHSNPRTPAERSWGVLGQAEFEAVLERERCLADRGTRRFTLLTLRAGSATGAFEELGGAVRRRLRSTDVVGRWGVGRLALLLTDTEPAGAAVVSAWVGAAARALGLELEQTLCVYPTAAGATPPPASAPPLVDLWPLLEVPTPLWK